MQTLQKNFGHKFICKALGIVRKEKPWQGVQEVIELFGKKEIVGFYNTFVGKYEEGLENTRKSVFMIKFKFYKNLIVINKKVYKNKI